MAYASLPASSSSVWSLVCQEWESRTELVVAPKGDCLTSRASRLPPRLRGALGDVRRRTLSAVRRAPAICCEVAPAWICLVVRLLACSGHDRHPLSCGRLLLSAGQSPPPVYRSLRSRQSRRAERRDLCRIPKDAARCRCWTASVKFQWNENNEANLLGKSQLSSVYSRIPAWRDRECCCDEAGRGCTCQD